MGSVPLSLAVLDLPCYARVERGLQGLQVKQNPLLQFHLLLGVSATHLQHGDIQPHPEGSVLLFVISRGVRSEQNHSCANAGPQRTLVNVKQMLLA